MCTNIVGFLLARPERVKRAITWHILLCGTIISSYHAIFMMFIHTSVVSLTMLTLDPGCLPEEPATSSMTVDRAGGVGTAMDRSPGESKEHVIAGVSGATSS